MESGNFKAFVEKKGFEIAYALFRLSTGTPQREYQERLQKSAFSLLEHSSLGEWSLLGQDLSLIEKYMQIGEEMGMLKQTHAALVKSEVSNLQSAIAASVKTSKLPDLDISGIFSEETNASTEGGKNIQEEIPLIGEDFHETVISDENDDDVASGGVKAAMRQSAILEKIRQIGNCRMRDLEEMFSDVSERTLRYDLQELIGQGLIERVGTGGPGVFYRMRVFEI